MSGRPREDRPASRMGGTLFFLVFAVMGLGFFGLMIFLGIQATAPHFWDEVPCVIEESRMETDENYYFRVLYRYEVEGKSYTGDTFQPGYGGSEEVEPVNTLRNRYPVGSIHRCRVKPSDPGQAVLQPGSPWIFLVALFPLVFVAVGVGGLLYTWRQGQEGSPSAPTRKPGKKKAAEWVGVGVGVILMVAGLALLVFWIGPLFMEARDARTWVEVPCQIISSKVRSHDSDDGTTYSVDIHYRYRFDGEVYDSNRYSFIGGSSSGYGDKAAIVRSYPSGSEAVCYVNPDNPARAVIQPEVGLGYLLGLIPLGMMAGGGVLVFFTLQKQRKRRHREEQARVTESGPVTLEPESSPVGRFVGIMAMALFWNGIVSVFVHQWWQGYERGSPDVFLGFFLIPFVLIGLGLIAAFFYQGMALLNPRVRLAVNQQPASLGSAFRVGWQFRGAVSRLQSLDIMLVGRERVQYSQGGGRRSRTVHHQSTFYRQELFRSGEASPDRSGMAEGSYPLALPPSLKGEVSQIVWTIEVNGRIPFWPDVSESFTLQINPAPLPAHE